MIAGGELIGSVSFGGATGDISRPSSVAIAQEVATQLAIVMAQARLHERVAARRRSWSAASRSRTRAS